MKASQSPEGSIQTAARFEHVKTENDWFATGITSVKPLEESNPLEVSFALPVGNAGGVVLGFEPGHVDVELDHLFS